MASQSYDVLLRTLGRGEVSPVYYLHGPEEILTQEATGRILDAALEPSSRDFNFEQRSAAELDAESLNDLLNTLPMMAGRRVVFLRDFESLPKKQKLREALLDYLERPSAETVLVITQGPPAERDRGRPDPEISRRAFTVESAALEPKRVLSWMSKHAEKRGFSFAPGAAEHLAEVTDRDLGAILAELEKLSSLGPDLAVTLEQVESLKGVRHGETLNDWRNAVLADDTPRALRLLGPVLEQSGNSGVKLLTALGTGLLCLELTRAHADRKLRDQALHQAVMDVLRRVRPFGLGNWKAELNSWMSWAPAWPLSRLRGALRAALQADCALKDTRLSDDRGVLAGLLLELRVKAREAA